MTHKPKPIAERKIRGVVYSITRAGSDFILWKGFICVGTLNRGVAERHFKIPNGRYKIFAKRPDVGEVLIDAVAQEVKEGLYAKVPTLNGAAAEQTEL